MKEIYDSGELIERATTRKIRVVRNEGKRKVSREIIFEKADKSKPFMGLSTWKNAPKGRILSSDVTQAKRHLQCGLKKSGSELQMPLSVSKTRF